MVDSASGNHADNKRLPGDVEKELYQRIVANDRLDIRFSLSCLASAVSAPTLGDLQAAKGVGHYLRKVLVAWQGFPFCDPRPGVLLCYAGGEWATGQVSRRSTIGGVVTLGGGVLRCWARKQRSVELSSWEDEVFSAITECTRSLGIQSELRVLGSSCVVVIASDSQIVMDLSRRRGHRLRRNMWVGLMGLRFQEAIADETLALEKVHSASNPADVCTTALPGDKICELRRFAFVFLCHSENTMGPDLEIWSLSQLDDRSGNSVDASAFQQPHEAEPDGACCFRMSQFCSQAHVKVAHSDHDCLGTTSHSSYWVTSNCFAVAS